MYTDDTSAYKGMDRRHEAVKHSVSEYVKRHGSYELCGVSLCGVEVVILRRVSPDVGEAPATLRTGFEGRHNRRPTRPPQTGWHERRASD